MIIVIQVLQANNIPLHNNLPLYGCSVKNMAKGVQKRKKNRDRIYYIKLKGINKIKCVGGIQDVKWIIPIRGPFCIIAMRCNEVYDDSIVLYHKYLRPLVRICCKFNRAI